MALHDFSPALLSFHPSFYSLLPSAWCQVWGLRSVPKCLQTTELQTSLQHFFKLDCCGLIFLLLFLRNLFYCFLFFREVYQTVFLFFFVLSPPPPSPHQTVSSVHEENVNRKREGLGASIVCSSAGWGTGQDNNRRARGRGSSPTWLIHHTWACFYIKTYLKD